MEAAASWREGEAGASLAVRSQAGAAGAWERVGTIEESATGS